MSIEIINTRLRKESGDIEPAGNDDKKYANPKRVGRQ